MRKNRALAALLLSLAVLLTSCGQAAEQPETQAATVKMGRYVEEEITPALLSNQESTIFPMGMFVHSGQAMELFAILYDKPLEKLIHLQSTDGGDSWIEADTAWYDKVYQPEAEAHNQILKIAMDKQKNIFCIVMTPDYQLRMVKVTEGALAEVKIQDWYSQEFYITETEARIDTFTITDKGDFAVTYGRYHNEDYLYDGATGELKARIESDQAPAFYQDEQITKLGYDEATREQYVVMLDYNGKELMPKLPYDGSATNGYAICAENHQTTFLATNHGIDRVMRGGLLLERILSGEKYRFGDPTRRIEALQFGPQDRCFYLLTESEMDGIQLFRYVFDQSLPLNTGRTLKIFALNDSETLRDAITKYQIAYPEQTVELQIGFDTESGATKEDAIRVLNTELLAKEGPDLLLLDGLPVEQYISKGVLADISQLTNAEEHLTNLTDIYQSNQEICAIPTRAVIPLMAAEPDLLQAASSLPALASMEKREPPLGEVYSHLELLKYFYSTYWPVLVDEAGQLNTELLSELLEQTKQLYLKYQVGDEARVLQEDKKLRTNIYDLNTIHRSLGPSLYIKGESRLCLFYITCFDDFANARLHSDITAEKVKGIHLAPLCGPVTNVFYPTNMMGINASSKNSEAARTFIATMLSEEVQSTNLREGLPVNRAAFARGYEASLSWQGLAYHTDVLSLVERLNVPVAIDEIILGAILDEATPYYEGEETLEQAVAQIAGSTKTYFAEKS